MAYHDASDNRHGSYASTHERAYVDRDQTLDHDVPRRTRSRADSHASDYQPRDKSPGYERRNFDPVQPPAHQPLKNAIGNAFDKSDTARVVDPDLIAQITEEVKRSVLQEIKFAASQSQPAPVPPPPQYYVPPSPASTSASEPPRNVYTPPSPKHTDLPTTSPVQDPTSRGLYGNDDTPTPRNEKSVPIDIPTARTTTRPPPPARMTTDDYTPIEKMWQRLFDSEGQPLPRLGEFLRGLALHLIEDYEPKKSLVVTPAKMMRFYEEVKLQDEIYPWSGELLMTTLTDTLLTVLSNFRQNRTCKLIQDIP